MTLKEIESSDKLFLLADDVAPLLNIDSQCLRSQAQSDPTKLGFPVVVTGKRVRIPREGFLHFLKYGYARGGDTA